eukprot:CAMPEP_0174941878 /NCGR_PEP_ID=MMETSP1355-20121228/72881_1 /TAXON_ID=464990 /ORGANISM="Hemiselmis tepida, Strain CCMP443" /LENGTH=365 /DNA_ID=CAMNT_0016189017 /DNA_START=78 /DNA_END=1172 /DNA_ORIENTATION=+
MILEEEQNASHLVEFAVLETRKGFCKKAILQLQAVESLRCVVSLTADGVQINSLPTLDMTAQLLKTRGSHAFALRTEGEGAEAGALLPQPVLCCAGKKKLMLYRWGGQGFDEWKEMALPDTPACMAWCGDSLCVGVGRRYVIINAQTGAEKPLFDSNSSPPAVFRLPGLQEMLLGRDSISVFQDFEGRPSRKYAITWAAPPSAIVYSHPYVIALLPKSVEVQLMETQKAVQTISLRAGAVVPSPRDDAAYVLANNQVYRLRPVPVGRQIDSLMEAGGFETALRLCEMCSDRPEVAAKADGVHRAYGLQLLSERDFEAAVSQLARCASLDPREVLSYFPDLCPEGFPPAASPLDLKGHQMLRAQVS